MNRKRSVIIVPLLVVGVYLAVWFAFGHRLVDSSDTVTAQEVTESSEPGDQASSDPSPLTETKNDLNARVEAFIPLYFNRDPMLTRDAHQQRVSDFVTTNFLVNHSFGLATPPDQALAKEGARVEAALYEDSIMGHLSPDATVAELEVVIEIKKFDHDGEEVSSNSFVQPMTWLKTKSGWKADSLY